MVTPSIMLKVFHIKIITLAFATEYTLGMDDLCDMIKASGRACSKSRRVGSNLLKSYYCGRN